MNLTSAGDGTTYHIFVVVSLVVSFTSARITIFHDELHCIRKRCRYLAIEENI